MEEYTNTLLLIVKYFEQEEDCKIEFIKDSEEGEFFIVQNEKYAFAITSCPTDYGPRIKLIDLIVQNGFRGQGIGTRIICMLKELCDIRKAVIGLWCETNDVKGYNWYIKNGFVHKCTKNDPWMEYGG